MSLMSFLTKDIFAFSKEEPVKLPPITPGMTREEFDDLTALCQAWLLVEKALIQSEGKEAIKDSAYYNIASFNVCKLEDAPKIFKHAHMQYTLNRLIQLYFNVCARYGRRRVLSWSSELQESVISLGQSSESVTAAFRDHPYLVLVPILNRVISLDWMVR
jgi:hypothetical protein